MTPAPAAPRSAPEHGAEALARPAPAREAPGLRTLTYGIALTIMLVWLLWLGRSLIVPLMAAVIVVYVLDGATAAMKRVPVLRRTPEWLLRGLALLAFAAAAILLVMVIVDQVTRVVAALPRYQANIEVLISRVARIAGIEGEPTWARVRQLTFDRIDTRALIRPALDAIRGLGTTVFLVLLYAAFILVERRILAAKIRAAFPSPDAQATVISVMTRVNDRLGRYLGVKTAVNAALAALSYAALAFMGVEFAPFWAIAIGLLNYIPYVGSVLGVAFPTLMAAAQFGSLASAATLGVLLTATQVAIGSVLEPPLMGRAFNLSPLVVLMSVAFWATLWGASGAILAVPLTASLVIVLGEFRRTRPLAVLLSGNPPRSRSLEG